LELTAPGACRADRERLYGQLRGGKIFSAFNEQERRAIWEKVLSISFDRLIPSFYSYFEDMNYFQGPVKCVKSLLEFSPRDSVSSALLRAFRDGNRRVSQYVVQESETSFVLRPGDSSVREDFALRQIWIIAMRYSEAKRDWKPSKATLCQIAAHAYRLEFKSMPILNLMQGSADRQIALKALLEARRPDRFKYDADAFEDYIEQMVRILSTAEALTEEEARDICEVENDGKPHKRCGVPKPKDHEQDKLSLFLDKLHDASEQQYPEITSLFVRRSVYFAFWGKPAHIANYGTSHEQTPAPEEEMVEAEVEEETREFAQQQQFTQPAEKRESQRQSEQERKTQAEEGRLAQLSERRQTEEGHLAQLSERRRAEEKRLAQLAEQRQAMLERLVQLAEQEESQRGGIPEQQRLAQISEQEGERHGEAEQETQAEEERLWLAEQESQRQAEDDRHRQSEQELFEADDIQETRTINRRKSLTRPRPNGEILSKLWKLDGKKPFNKKPKLPRGIGVTRKENDRKRVTQIDLGEFVEPINYAQVESSKQIHTLVNNANLVKGEQRQT
jgi:hypothetical protein